MILPGNVLLAIHLYPVPPEGQQRRVVGKLINVYTREEYFSRLV